MGEATKPRVRLHKYRDRPYGLIWRTGARHGEISSGTANRREAERAAGRLELDLQEGRLPGTSEGLATTWGDFRTRYEIEWLEGLSYGSQKGWSVAVGHFERICKPRFLSDVNKSMLSAFRGQLESMDISSSSARSYYRAIHAGLGWAESVDLIGQVPSIRQRKRGQANARMRNRVISGEEFERIIEAIGRIRKGDALPFQRFTRALWLSGLRISELNRLRWERDAPLHVDLSGKLPLIVILGQQKNHNDTYLPAPLEFWGMIDKPGVQRTGRVFPVAGRYGDQMTTRNIGRRIADAGRSAGVVVDPSSGKCATAHDLRAAYLTRVAAATTMSQAQALARHSDPKTTSQFYVRHQAEELAKAAGW